MKILGKKQIKTRSNHQTHKHIHINQTKINLEIERAQVHKLTPVISANSRKYIINR